MTGGPSGDENSHPDYQKNYSDDDPRRPTHESIKGLFLRFDIHLAVLVICH
jgi:hypothetical protein